MTYIRQNIDIPTLPQDIYNQQAAIRQSFQGGQSATEALLSHLVEKSIYHVVELEALKNRLQRLFIACPNSIKHLQTNHDVLLLDNTYKTNRFDMPLLNSIG
jgi:hypothetical protein